MNNYALAVQEIKTDMMHFCEGFNLPYQKAANYILVASGSNESDSSEYFIGAMSYAIVAEYDLPKSVARTVGNQFEILLGFHHLLYDFPFEKTGSLRNRPSTIFPDLPLQTFDFQLQALRNQMILDNEAGLPAETVLLLASEMNRAALGLASVRHKGLTPNITPDVIGLNAKCGLVVMHEALIQIIKGLRHSNLETELTNAYLILIQIRQLKVLERAIKGLLSSDSMKSNVEWKNDVTRIAYEYLVGLPELESLAAQFRKFITDTNNAAGLEQALHNQVDALISSIRLSSEKSELIRAISDSA